MAKRTISFAVEDFEYNEILRYARMKGHGGQFPTSTFAHYAVMQQMKKYPLSDGEIEKHASTYEKGADTSMAVQPDPPKGH